ncbi:anti-phage dCTP deaminase [Aquidulcibacter sp.]|jgi:deoxycytidylate deaminase|uniref:anti-phage dCTP deaminase n=1 Tax=Aquidulcibacter sp. TaxID=2052990 RepID=UPI003783E06A
MNDDQRDLQTKPNSETHHSRTFEIFLGITAKIGTEKQILIDRLIDLFSAYGYTVEKIKVTSILKMQDSSINFDEDHSVIAKYKKMIDVCNGMRTSRDDIVILARWAIANIRQKRKLITGNERPNHSKKIVYIIDQLKLPGEIEFMRSIYGPRYYQIGITSSYEARLSNIVNKEGSALRKRPEDIKESAAHLIKQDDAEEGNQFGQDVRDAFASSDFFVDPHLPSEIDRFVAAIFGGNDVSPSIDELGMGVASLSALRSADLSRQVGAALCSEDGEIVSTGCNEVPKPGGGQYWYQDDYDRRDLILGFDQNAKIKDQIREQIVHGIMATLKLETEVQREKIYEQLFDSPNAPLKDSMLSDLTEFGRAVHAEMAALMDAARRGISTKGLTLYCTTFPCHNCAKHIIASGIKKVIYIEPYPKSRALDLHEDAIICRAILPNSGANKVEFAEFLGIGPNKIGMLFKRKKRKDGKGNFTNQPKQDSVPIGMPLSSNYDPEEILALQPLQDSVHR